MSELDILAGEYVLGSLDAEERAAFAARLVADPAAQAAVAAWELRFAPLATVGDEVEPSATTWAATWARIAAGLRPAANPSSGVPAAAPQPAAETGALLRALAASRARWRAATLVSAGSALAASVLAATLALRPAAAPPPIMVAVVNRDGAKPALLIRVDLATRRVTVRPIAAMAPPGHSLELWAVDAPAAPRSLGLVGAAPATLVMPEGAGAGTTFAVSLEPKGGSTTGGPTGPVIYSGQLIEP